MSVVVSCHCGQQFKTDDRHAGKRIPCPACGAVMTIPAAGTSVAVPPSVKQRGLRVQCPCGWAFQAPPECEGKNVRCPGCNGAILVPAADPLGVGPLESIAAATLYSGRYDPAERLAKQLAWVAGGSVALMLFGMVITYLIFHLPNRSQPASVVAQARTPAKQPNQQPAPQRATPAAPAAPEKGPVAATDEGRAAGPSSAGSRQPFGPAPPPASAVATDAAREGDTADPFERMKFGPRFGPRGPRVGPRGPRIGPPVPGDANPPSNESPRASEETPSKQPDSRPDATADSGPPPVTKLPNSVQAWFEQPGDKLTGIRRVGSDQSPNAHFSWMTALLPFIDQQQVYEKFDFNQSVDSDRNLKAGATQIPAFLNPLDDRKTWDGYPFHGMALTHFVGMSGVEDSRNVVAAKLPRSDPRAGVFGYDEVARPAQITDGQSQTIMMTGAGDLSNPWLFGGGGTIRGVREPLFSKTSGLGTKGLAGGGTIVVMADGSVRHVNASVDPQVFKSMSTIHGADPVDVERSAPQYSLDQLRSATAGAPHSSYTNQRSSGR